MSLKASYRLFAPFYDRAIRRATARPRERSLGRLHTLPPQRILISGAGTGLDFPFLTPTHDYVALDLTAAMLARSRHRAQGLRMAWVQGDSMELPFPDASFDCVVLHLILAVVPNPPNCLAEAARVLKPGGRILVFDKFLRRGEHAWVRRALNPLTRHIATRLDVVLEDLLESVPQLRILTDQPALAGGWFRLLELEKS